MAKRWRQVRPDLHGLLLSAAMVCLLTPVVAGQTTPGASQSVYIEDSPAALELGFQALDLSQQGRFADAAQLLQQVIEQYPHKLMPSDESSYTDALLWVRRQVSGDERLLEAYRSMFGPIAARKVAQALPTPQQLIDVDALLEVLTHYTLTAAGLEAGLTLAAYHLERAEADDASGVLDELIDHPDLPMHKQRYHELRAVAALLTDDRQGFESHRLAIPQRDEPNASAGLDALINRFHPPTRVQDNPPQDNPELPESLDEPLWDIDLLDELWQDFGQRVDIRNMPVEQAVLRVLPALDQQRIYVNLGETIIVYDRASGWQLWQQPEQADGQSVRLMLTPGRVARTEPRGVYLLDGRVYALLGWMSPSIALRQTETADVELIAMEQEDGEPLWRIRAGDLDPAWDDASFDGTPIGDGGRLFVIVKRVRVSGLQDLYLAAVRPQDGSLIWRRHLSSTSSQNNYNIGPSARLICQRGRVYVSDNRGTVLALDARWGVVRWAAILPDAGQADPINQRAVRAIKDEPEPVLVEAGLLVPPVESDGGYRVLDPSTGQVLRELHDRGWREVEACYAAGKNVITVGGAISCFDGASLEQLWRKDLDSNRDGQVRGRPAVAVKPVADPTKQANDGLVVLSTDHRLLALNLSDGAVLSDVANAAPGNVAMTHGQVVVASTADLHAYTDWSVAYRQLKVLASQQTADPRPGMAMARLALRSGRDAEVLEGITLATDSLQTPAPEPEPEDDRQQQVFDLLHQFIDPTHGADVDLRGDLLDRMAAVSSGPSQEAAYQLLRGHYLVEVAEPERAVEHYQAVLADRALANELYNAGRHARRAGLIAKQRLSDLIEAHGRGVYQAYDLLAEHDLAELIGNVEMNPNRYAELADRYPLALCVNDIRQYAADYSLGIGDVPTALRQLQNLYLDATDSDQQAEATGRIVEVYLDDERPELAQRWLKRVQREHPDLMLKRGDQFVHIQSWLSELQQVLSATRRLPRFGLPLQEPIWIDGRALPAEAEVVDGFTQHDDVLMTDGGREIWLLSAESLAVKWRKSLPAQGMRVLAIDGRQVLWWSGQAKRIGAIDCRTGEPLWEAINFQQELDNAGDPRLQVERRTIQQQRFVQVLGGIAVQNPRNLPGGDPTSEIHTAVDPTTVVLVDRLGRAICIDRDTGQVRWRTLGQADSLTSVALGDGLVAMGGANWADTEAQHGVITLMDTLTGEPLETVIQTEKVPSWLGFADNGLLITAKPGGVSGYDPVTGRTEWSSDLSTNADNSQYRLGGHLLIAAEQRGAVGTAQVFDTYSGRVVNQLPIRAATGRPMLFEAVEADGLWHTITPMQAVALNASGQLLWSDAICAPVGHILTQHLSDRYVSIVGGRPSLMLPNVQQLQDQGQPEMQEALARIAQRAERWSVNSGYRLYLLDRESGLIESETALDQVKQPIDPAGSTLINGALLLGVGDRTLVVKGSIPPD